MKLIGNDERLTVIPTEQTIGLPVVRESLRKSEGKTFQEFCKVGREME